MRVEWLKKYFEKENRQPKSRLKTIDSSLQTPASYITRSNLPP